MYSFYIQKLWAPPCFIGKLFLIMRLTTIILFMAIFQVSAGSYAQRISLSEKNSRLVSVFDKISKQSGYDFFVSAAMFEKAKPVNIQVSNMELKEVLRKILENQPFEFSIEDKSVLIKEKTSSFIDRLISSFRDIDVRGKVLGENREVLAGAVVRIKGTSRVTVSDDKGAFYLTKVDEDAVLQISYLGYVRKELKVRADIGDINMVRITSNLDEVSVLVNTGYQKIKKDQLTGAASTVSEKQYQQRVAVTGNFLESLEGKVPGLVYNGQSGELTIRGVSTFDAVKQPLIVLDGFPTEIDLRTINPNDIVSISVLRDAAAASIYGVRASNGVIIVETKRGKSGKPVVNFNVSYALQKKPDFSYLNYVDSREYIQLQKDKFYISRTPRDMFDYGYYKMNPIQEILFRGPRFGVSNPEWTQEQVDGKLAELGNYNNLKEYQDLFYQNKQVKNVNLDVSGGGPNSTYFVGLNYINETPVEKTSNNKQINLNVANTLQFSKRFSADIRSTFTHMTNESGNVPAYSDFLPFERLADENGNALPVSLGPERDFISAFITEKNNKIGMEKGLYDMYYYPYKELFANRNNKNTDAFKIQARFNGKIADWLSAEVGGNYELQSSITNNLQTEDAFALRRLINSMALTNSAGRAMFTNMPQGDVLRKRNNKLQNYTLRAQLNLNKEFGNGKHSLSAIIGAEQRKTSDYGYLTSFFGYDNQSLISKPINLNALNTSEPPYDLQYGIRFRSTNYFGETDYDKRFASLYGQGTYIFDRKYVLTGSFRNDQSNLFGVDPKYKNKGLWSVGANWRMGEEDFIKNTPWIDMVQFRAATGFNGNVPSSTSGRFLTLSTGLNTRFETPLIYNEILTPMNQALRWETTRNYNYGVDYAFFNNRISGSVDYYIKRSTDVFGQFESDPTSGFNQYNANTASIENKGLDILINSLNVKRSNWEWRTQVTASFNHNKVLSVKATEFDNSERIVTASSPIQGLPLGALYAYNYGGLNRLGQPFVYNKQGDEVVLSLFSFGSGIADVTKDDLIYKGTTVPKYVVGLNNQFTFGRVDLSFLIMYYGGHVMRVEQPLAGNVESGNYPLKGASNVWKKPGDENSTRIPGYSTPNPSNPGYFTTTTGYEYAAEFVRKADYLRLRDLIVTYRPEGKMFSKLGLKQPYIRFQAQNLFRYTFSGNDIDPEAIDRLSGKRMLKIEPIYSITLSTNF